MTSQQPCSSRNGHKVSSTDTSSERAKTWVTERGIALARKHNAESKAKYCNNITRMHQVDHENKELEMAIQFYKKQIEEIRQIKHSSRGVTFKTVGTYVNEKEFEVRVQKKSPKSKGNVEDSSAASSSRQSNQQTSNDSSNQAKRALPNAIAPQATPLPVNPNVPNKSIGEKPGPAKVLPSVNRRDFMPYQKRTILSNNSLSKQHPPKSSRQ